MKINSRCMIATTFVLAIICFGFQHLIAQPVIKSFSPTSGIIGTVVKIKGNNFNSAPQQNIVYFGATKAVISNATDTSLTVAVPQGATYQPITVTTDSLTASSKQPFLVTFTGGSTTFTSSSFSAEHFLSGSQCPIELELEDLDGDGKPDIAYTNGCTNGLSFLRNTSLNGSVSFTPGNNVITNKGSFGLAVYDLDGDGKKDIVTANFFANPNNDGDSVSVFKNTSTPGTISFSAEKIYGTGGDGTYDVAIADLDGDGKPEIIATNEYSFPGSISVLKNVSTKDSLSFATKQDFTVGSEPRHVTACDLNNDNKPDLLVADQGSGAVTVLINTSTSNTISFNTQQYATTFNSYPESVSCGDLDGDGKLDLVVANNNENGTVSILKNTSGNGNVSFVLQPDLPAIAYPFSIVITDMNGDGKPDITVSSRENISHYVSVYENKSTVNNLSFGQAANYPILYTHNTVLAGDLNADNKPDILLNNDLSGEPLFTVLTNTQGSVLAINSVNLKVSRLNNRATLQWETKDETNTSYFKVERSTNASNFEDIGRVNADAYSSFPVDYSFTDTNAFPYNNRMLYYRIKRFNKDGSFDYSNIATITLDDNPTISIYPIPVNDVLNINGLNTAGITYLQIIDEKGNVAAKRSIQNTSFYKWNITALSKGMYYLLIASGTKNTSLKFVKK